MKVTHTWNPNQIEDLDCETLLYRAAHNADHGGQIEDLKAHVDTLIRVVGAIIERMPVSDKEKLHIIGAEYAYKVLEK